MVLKINAVRTSRTIAVVRTGTVGYDDSTVLPSCNFFSGQL